MGSDSEKLWKYALVQHPMWLIIAEDSICAERTPPWGCASLDEYARRLERGLDALERFPELHLNFDFSAMELEDLAARCPDMMVRIRSLASSGRITFLNGTCSQPHLHILSVESAIRQFEEGLSVITGLTGCAVTCYASQEPGFSPQLPQILRAFGYTTACTPDFPFGLVIEQGSIQHWDKKWEWLAGDDMVRWRGLDGSEIALWLKSSGYFDESACSDDAQHGLLHRARLRTDMPDMVEIDEDWVRRRSQVCAFVRLDKTLRELADACPPETVARIDANYAYVEGVDAEELSRANVRAETALFTLEAGVALLRTEDAPDLSPLWKTLLACQHHDAYWTGAPELRAKSIAKLNDLTLHARDELERLCDRLLHQMPQEPNNDSAVMLLHPYARPHKMPVTFAARPGCALFDSHGRELPAQASGDGMVTMIAEAGGAGCVRVVSRPGDTTLPREDVFKDEFQYCGEFYSAIIERSGRISLRAGNADLNGNIWQYIDDGRIVSPVISGPGTATRGPVFDRCELLTRLADIDIRTRVTFYHALPWFEVETCLHFEQPTELGDFFDDRTKLHFSWTLSGVDSIRYASGGCPEHARIGRSFPVYPWLDVSSKTGGIALCFFNATKCWVDASGHLNCVAAWGHNGDRFHNRQGPLPGIMGPLNWSKSMDLRLRGDYTIRYCVWPHADDAGNGVIADWAACLHLPPVALSVQRGWQGVAEEFVALNTPGLIPLSLRRVGEGEVALRFMEVDGIEWDLDVVIGRNWQIAGLHNLDGSACEKVRPYAIAEVLLRGVAP